MKETNVQFNSLDLRKKKINLSTPFLVLLILSVLLNMFLILKGANISGAAFKYIEPAVEEPIDNNIQDENTILHYSGLRNILEQEIKQYSSLENIGLFVQDVKTGAWMGINERKGFQPASLLKIPIMMAILKKIELGEMSLKDTLTITASDVDGQYGLLYQRVGEKMSVEGILEAMITFSDNTAKNVLKRKLSIYEIDNVFKHIGISDPYLGTDSQIISARDYIRFFKALYYSTFLSSSSSEFALRLATDTQQEGFLAAGIPSQIQVAHKFGITADNSLHDCGIVYHKENPYFICIMTKDNTNLEKTSELFRVISKDVYKFVESKS